ncbi:pyridoxal 5'-phosphate synthase [Muricauda sp. ANG21]|uniref:pyridoxine/pyridoxamine 5'-phosphate oxidase n=1 Tax=Allomuricauda sp. ANG21 TaxID=3042468 RepID=UPI00345500AE
MAKENNIKPIELFNRWYTDELNLRKEKIPSVCCLSTIGVDGFPNARYISLKEVAGDCFSVTGPVTSRKGIEVSAVNKIALTFWWKATERQVRIQGIAHTISERQADKYFNKRSLYSQAVSSICDQGKEIEYPENLKKRVLQKVSEATKIIRPNNWGVFSIKPIRMEFMEFKESRFHDRKLFELGNNGWTLNQIQP